MCDKLPTQPTKELFTTNQRYNAENHSYGNFGLDLRKAFSIRYIKNTNYLLMRLQLKCQMFVGYPSKFRIQGAHSLTKYVLSLTTTVPISIKILILLPFSFSAVAFRRELTEFTFLI